MAKKPVSLTQALAKELLHYDPETGVFTWRTRARSHFKSDRSHGRWNTCFAGKKAGTTQQTGYITLGIFGRIYQVHRVAWLYVTGNWPTKHIDHRNENKADNCWDNLREASPSENQFNHRFPTSKNTTGFRGVSRRGKRYKAQCGHTYLGDFATAEDAHAAYVNALNEMAGEFSPYRR